MFNIIFCAVPAFNLEDPAITSGPTSGHITRPASSAIRPLGLQVTTIVLQLIYSALFKTPSKYLGLPLADITTATSLSVRTFASS